MSSLTVTLRQVAAAAGCGVATASRALSGDARCARATRERVQAAAQRLGYVPDPGVAALARRRSGRSSHQYPLVWLWERPQPPVGEDAKLVAAVRREAEARGYFLSLELLPELGGPREAGRILEARGVLGCFLSSLDDQHIVEAFPWDRFAVMSYLQENFVLPFNTVRPDMFALMFHAWERALASGAQRIGAVIPSSHIARENDLLLSACAYHQREAGAAAVPVLVLKATSNGKQVNYSQETLAWFERHRPDLVIGKTEGAYWALHEAGLRCPQDFRFLTIRRQDSRGLIAGFEWRISAMAEALMAGIHTQISQGQRGPRETPGTWMVDGRWRDGASLPRVAPA